MRQARRVVNVRLLACVLVLLLPTVAAMPAAMPLVPLRGLLEPQGPVLTHGHAATEDQQQFLANWTIPADAITDTIPTYNGTIIYASVWEWKWQTLADPATHRDTEVPTLSTSEVHSYLMRAPLMRLIGKGQAAHFLIASSHHDTGHLDLGDNAACSLVPERATPIDYHRLRPSEYSPNISPEAAPTMVDAKCRSDGLTTQGPKTLYFYDAELYFSYVDHDTLGNDVSRQLDAVLGVSTKANRSAQGVPMYDHVDRLLTLWIPEAHARFAVQGPTEVEVRTPAFLANGVVKIPASRGDIVWGAWKDSDHVPALAPEGAFRVGAAPHLLSIHGATTNDPPLIVAAHVRGLRLSPSWSAAGVGIAVSALLAALTPWGRSFLAGLFTRLDKDDALSHERRNLILDFVREQPASPVQAVAEALRMPRASVRYHAAVLGRQGLLTQRRFGRSTALFVTGAVSWNEQPAHHRANQPAAKSILERLEAEPTASQTRLAAALGMSQPYVSRVLRTLANLGLVERNGGPRAGGYRVLLPQNGTQPPAASVSPFASPAPASDLPTRRPEPC